MIGFVLTWTVGFTLSNIFQCIPFSVNWDFAVHNPGYNAGTCIDVNRMLFAQAWSDVATNIVIILLPLGPVSTASPLTLALQLIHNLDMGTSDAILEKDRSVRRISIGSTVRLRCRLSYSETNALQDCGLRHS